MQNSRENLKYIRRKTGRLSLIKVLSFSFAFLTIPHIHFDFIFYNAKTKFKRKTERPSLDSDLQNQKFQNVNFPGIYCVSSNNALVVPSNRTDLVSAFMVHSFL